MNGHPYIYGNQDSERYPENNLGREDDEGQGEESGAGELENDDAIGPGQDTPTTVHNHDEQADVAHEPESLPLPASGQRLSISVYGDDEDVDEGDEEEHNERSDNELTESTPETVLPAYQQQSYKELQETTASVKNRRRVLVIAYYYPPMGLSGVLRISKFTKYLSQFGWEPTVLTVGDVGYFAHDEALLHEMEQAGVQIVRTTTLDPLRMLKRKKDRVPMPADTYRRFLSGVTHIFLQPDNKIGWKRYAVKKALELTDEIEFDAILATAPPFTDFLVGLEVHKQRGIPLVVDYRDPWLDNKNYFFATPFHKNYAFGLEQSILKNADGVVVVNRRIKESLISRYPFLTHETVHIIPSGYDPNEFETAHPETVRSRKMRFTYSGVFDARRTPKFFFSALAKIFARHPETRDEIEACFIGSFKESYKKMAAKLGVASALVTTGYVEHANVINYLLSSDVLWLTMYDPGITPGKVYEYIGSRKPILALAPEGVVRQVLNGYNASECVDPEDVDAIAETMYTMYLQWKQGTLPCGNEGLAADYSQLALTENLARVLAYSLKV